MKSLALCAIALLCACSSAERVEPSTSMQGAIREDVPLACSLNEGDLDERKALIAELTRGIAERRDTAHGIAYRFDPAPGLVARLGRLIDLERDCCQFMTFAITVDQADGPIWLELNGPKSARSAIEEYFGR
ncbi:MAG: hypothetical protein IPH13_11940 [Planctomycetes bacterium]|nr:hypothetical protein [Planctomycetota bacterium]MCC7172738.1 hypothetical protein [Planctomycetota bacterium]